MQERKQGDIIAANKQLSFFLSFYLQIWNFFQSAKPGFNLSLLWQRVPILARWEASGHCNPSNPSRPRLSSSDCSRSTCCCCWHHDIRSRRARQPAATMANQHVVAAVATMASPLVYHRKGTTCFPKKNTGGCSCRDESLDATGIRKATGPRWRAPRGSREAAGGTTAISDTPPAAAVAAGSCRAWLRWQGWRRGLSPAPMVMVHAFLLCLAATAAAPGSSTEMVRSLGASATAAPSTALVHTSLAFASWWQTEQNKTDVFSFLFFAWVVLRTESWRKRRTVSRNGKKNEQSAYKTLRPPKPQTSTMKTQRGIGGRLPLEELERNLHYKTWRLLKLQRSTMKTQGD